MRSDAAALLAIGTPDIDMGGVLAGGVVIASLGVLDDVITTQVATVDEISKANRQLGAQELYRRAFSVGKEHISSLVNTIVLVYAGSALPIVILLTSSSSGNGLMLFNGEYLSAEIYRTIITSIGLVVAVPISTFIAAKILSKNSITS